MGLQNILDNKTAHPRELRVDGLVTILFSRLAEVSMAVLLEFLHGLIKVFSGTLDDRSVVVDRDGAFPVPVFDREIATGEKSGKTVCCHRNISDARRQLLQANAPLIRVAVAQLTVENNPSAILKNSSCRVKY